MALSLLPTLVPEESWREPRMALIPWGHVAPVEGNVELVVRGGQAPRSCAARTTCRNGGW